MMLKVMFDHSINFINPDWFLEAKTTADITSSDTLPAGTPKMMVLLWITTFYFNNISRTVILGNCFDL